MFEWAPIFTFFWSLQLRHFLFTRPQMMHKWVHFSHVSKSKQHILVVYICCLNQEQALCGGSSSRAKKAGDCRRPVEPQTTLEVEFKLNRRYCKQFLLACKQEWRACSHASAVCDKRRLQTCRPQTCRLADLQTCGLAETFGTHGEGGEG